MKLISRACFFIFRHNKSKKRNHFKKTYGKVFFLFAPTTKDYIIFSDFCTQYCCFSSFFGSFSLFFAVFSSEKTIWKSCKSQTRLRGFESLALRQKMIPIPLWCWYHFSFNQKQGIRTRRERSGRKQSGVTVFADGATSAARR